MVTSIEEMLAAMRAGAAETMAADPAGPQYSVVHFQEEKPAFGLKLDHKVADFAIETTYCVSVRRNPVQPAGVSILDYTYSDRWGTRGLGKSIGNVNSVRYDIGDEGWRLSYRVKEPDAEPLNVALLLRRLEKQRFAKGRRTPRHDTAFARLRKEERRNARRRAKEMRIRRHLAIDLEEASASGSCSSGSDSASSSS